MRRKPLLVLLIAVFVVFACGPRTESVIESRSNDLLEEVFEFNHESFKAFFDNLSALCGKTFEGRQVYMQEGRESWDGMRMVMKVDICMPNAIHIPFHLDEDHSRTWMFLNEDGRLRFRHDHRHEDGTPEDVTLYGGYADEDRGTPFFQVFPADEYTIDLLERGLGAEWVAELSSDLSVFSYQLFYQEELLFQADFDLTREINK